MTSPNWPLRGAAALGVACTLLAACASSPATRYYALTAPAPAAPAASAASYAGLPIEVRAVQVPPAMDRLELIRELSPGEFAVLDFDHWAAPLGRLARQALSEDLVQRLPKDRVVVPGAAWPAERASLSVDVLSFDKRDGQASMVASWALSQPPASGAAPAPIGATVRVVAPASADAAGTAQAWSLLMAQVADRIAAGLVP